MVKHTDGDIETRSIGSSIFHKRPFIKQGSRFLFQGMNLFSQETVVSQYHPRHATKFSEMAGNKQVAAF